MAAGFCTGACAVSAGRRSRRPCVAARNARTGGRLDAVHRASGDAVQEGAPGGAVAGGTVCGISHLLHGWGLTLSGRCLRHPSGAVVRHRVTGCTVNKAMGPPSGLDDDANVAAGTIARGQTGRAAHGLDDACTDPALREATHGYRLCRSCDARERPFGTAFAFFRSSPARRGGSGSGSLAAIRQGGP